MSDGGAHVEPSVGAPAPEPFYRWDGDGLVPGPLAFGPPWVPDSQHGSMVAALMARAVESTPAAAEMALSRLTVELARPVRRGRTSVATTIVRDGRRLQVLDLTLVVDGEPWARGTATRVRREAGVIEPSDEPEPWADDAAPPGPGQAVAESPLGADALWDAHDARWEDATAGAGRVWLRPHHPLVEGEALSATVRAAMVADLVMSGGGLLPTDRYVVVNPDLTVMLSRPPVGEWLRLHSRVRLRPDGTGQSEGTLFDEQGWIGRATKSLLIDRRSVRLPGEG